MNFAQLYEIVIQENSLEIDDGETKSSTVFLKQDPEFWDKLASVANSDPEGVADLLDVDPDIVGTWYSRIKEASKKADAAKDEKERNEMMPTGV